MCRDEDAPAQIPDESAVKPDGWLDDEPEYIGDPDSVKPEDWYIYMFLDQIFTAASYKTRRDPNLICFALTSNSEGADS